MIKGRDQPIMLIFYLLCYAPVLKFNVVTVLLENIKSSTLYSCTNNNHSGCFIRVY